MWSWPADNDWTFSVDRALFYIYSIPKAKCRPGHLNVDLLNIAIGHGLRLQSLHHNPHYHQHQHQGDLTLGWSLNFFCDVNRDLIRSFTMNKECRFLCHFFDILNTMATQQLKLATFTINKGDGSENVTIKMNWPFLKSRLFQFTENSQCRPISLELISLGPNSSLERERKVCCCLFTSSIKCETRHFHVVVVQ